MSWSEHKFCRIVSQRAAPIDYRPAFHNYLFRSDDTFDSKYSAMVWCHKLVINTMKSIFKLYHEPLTRELIADIYPAAERSNTDHLNRSIRFSAVMTGKLQKI